HSTQTALKFEQLPTFPHLMPSAVQHCPPDARLVKNHSQYATRLPRSCFVRYHATHHSGPCRTLRLSKPAAEFQHYEAFRKSVTMRFILTLVALFCLTFAASPLHAQESASLPES